MIPTTTTRRSAARLVGSVTTPSLRFTGDLLSVALGVTLLREPCKFPREPAGVERGSVSAEGDKITVFHITMGNDVINMVDDYNK